MLDGLEAPTRLAPPRSGLKPTRPSRIDLNLSTELTAELARLALRNGVTLNTVMQAAWGILLARMTAQSDVVFGITVSGRPPEVDGVGEMIGLLVNTLPLRLRINPQETVAALLVRLQDEQAKLLDHHHTGLGDIQALAGFDELFDTLVAFENYPVDRAMLSWRPGGLRIIGAEGWDATHYTLGLLVLPGEQLLLRFGYRPELLDQQSADALVSRFAHVLTQIVEAPAPTIRAIDIFLPGERTRLLKDRNATARDLPSVPLPSLFELAVERSPKSIALTYEGDRLSYRELNQRANRLAHVLIGEGAGPEAIVAIALPRSIEQVVAIVAVLKSGAAYLPLDPDAPPQRFNFMLAEAKPAALIARSETVERMGNPGGGLGGQPNAPDPARFPRLERRPCRRPNA